MQFGPVLSYRWTFCPLYLSSGSFIVFEPENMFSRMLELVAVNYVILWCHIAVVMLCKSLLYLFLADGSLGIFVHVPYLRLWSCDALFVLLQVLSSMFLVWMGDLLPSRVLSLFFEASSALYYSVCIGCCTWSLLKCVGSSVYAV